MIGSNALGQPSWKPELLQGVRGCRAAEVKGLATLESGRRGVEEASPGQTAVGNPGDRVGAEGAGLGLAGRPAGSADRLGVCAAAGGRRRGSGAARAAEDPGGAGA